MRRLRKNFAKWVVVSLFCLWLGFLLGKFKHDILRDSLALMTNDLQSLQAEKVQLYKKIAAFQTKETSDKQTISKLTQENKVLNQRLNLSANKLYFYERVVAPELETKGVKIYSFTVSEKADSGQWNYELVLMQAQKGRRFLSGDFELIFSVVENELLKKIPLTSLAKKTESRFKFKYFQTLKGAFTLPPDISVDEITLQINVTGNRWYKGQQLEQVYDWQTLTEKDEVNAVELDALGRNITDSLIEIAPP